ncbi:YolD-like family protein [Staphylococcus sp. GDY8P100P]|uniref:YolD-like family protein n=1 Tax=Staphylococcus sp. GDY8P100P TaxID=2804429 RepID=UPI001950B81D|nr:YolD-like family protein [Staphylococcus sp. GDY8P100P]
MIPDKYKNETDYRKIPREYLTQSIPKGRGMVKWAPFATLPEQFTRIQQYIIDQNKIDRPILSDDQLNNLNFQLHQSLHNNTPIHVEYYCDGWLEHKSIYIKKIDMLQMTLIGESKTDSQIVQLSLVDITNIQQITTN